MSEPTKVMAVRLPRQLAQRIEAEAERRRVPVGRVLTDGIELYEQAKGLPPVAEMPGQGRLIDTAARTTRVVE